MAQTLDSRCQEGAVGVRLTLASLLAVTALFAGGCGVFGGDETTTTTVSETTEGETSTTESATDEEATTAEETAAETDATAGDTEAGALAAENEAATADETAAAASTTTTADGTVTTVPAETVTTTTAADGTVTTVPVTTAGTTTTASVTGEIIPPPSATATEIQPVRSRDVTNVQAGLSMIPGLGSRATIPRFFSSGSPWNTDVSDEPADPRSEQLTELAQLRPATVEQADGSFVQVLRRIKERGLTVNTTKWTDPLFTEQGGQPTVAVCRQVDCGPDAVDEITIPPNARPDPRYDGWMTVIDTQSREALDFWRARREQDGSISYHFVKKWDLNGPGFQEPGGVSARGSGLPLFAGLIRPEEIDRGRIDHALAISIPGAAKEKFVQPASRTNGVGKRSSIPEGARIRLRFRNSDESINRACTQAERSRDLVRNEALARARDRDARNQDRGRDLDRIETRNLTRVRDRDLARDLARARRRPCGLATTPEAQLSDTFVRNDVQRRTAQVIIEALKHYGAIVVDRSASPTLYAQRNARWRKILPLNLIQDLTLDNFEVLELPPTLNDPGSFELIDPITGLPTASAASVPSSAPGVDGDITTTETTTTPTTGTTTTTPTTTTTTPGETTIPTTTTTTP
ncbi:MAG: hypothetical protein ACR2OC_02210 [Solirubrobacterales bacterium]